MTNINIPDNLNEVMKPADLLVCCNCAKRGHDSSTCNEYRWSQHFPTPAYVSSYTDGPGYTPATSQSNQSRSSNRQQTPNSLPSMTPAKFHEASQSQQSSTKKKRAKSSQDEDIIPIRTTEDPFAAIRAQDYKTIYSCGKYNGRKPGVRYAKRFPQAHVKTAGFVNGKVTPTFLKELMQHLHMGFEVAFHYRPDNRLLMDIKSYSAYFGKLVYKLTFHWMQLSDDEKLHAMMIRLPVNRERMIEFLKAKMPELKVKYDADVLWPRVKMLKEQMILNKDPALRIGIMKELIDSQSKLVKMVQTKPRIPNGVNVIKKFLNELACSNLQKVEPHTFVSILGIFNKFFTSYTPPEICYIAKMTSDAHKAIREAKNNQNQEDTASVGINAQQDIVNQSGSRTENIDTYRTEAVQFSQDNEGRNCDETIQFANNIPPLTISVRNNLYMQNQEPSLPNKPQIPPQMQCPRINTRNHEVVDFTGHVSAPLMPVRNNNVPNELPESSGNQYPTATFNDEVEAIQVNEPCAARNKKKSEKNKKAKKAKKGNNNLLNKFMQFRKQKANVQRNLMQRAHKALANAVAFELPYMTKEAAQVAKRMSNNTLKPKHVDVLQRLVNLEKSYQKEVDSGHRIPG